MKPKSYSPEIQRALMHGVPFNGTPLLPAMVSEKLNGLRCVYYPGQGFYSKSGKRWRDGVLDHIKISSSVPLDGELYARGLNLQEIVENVGVNNYGPGPRAGEIKLWAFDTVDRAQIALNRYIDVQAIAKNSTNVVAHTQHIVETIAGYEGYLRALRGTPAEGVMVKRTSSIYKRGREGQLLKVKFFHSDDFPLIDVVEGEGKAANHVGAFVFERAGKRFEVGTAQISYAKRQEIYLNMQQPYGHCLYTARVKYLTLSSDGIPQNASVEAIWEE